MIGPIKEELNNSNELYRWKCPKALLEGYIIKVYFKYFVKKKLI